MNFGRNLGIIMLDRNIKACDLAEKVGVSVSAISKIKRRQRKPSLELAEKIAEALGVSLDELNKN